MPKVIRNYERKDFSDLLDELHIVSLEEKKEQGAMSLNSKEQQDNKKIVDIAHRRRSSKMDNRLLRYAYSMTKMVLHDRDCKLVKSIPDNDFEMLSDFDADMETCKYCYRNALVRQGIGDDRKRLSAYIWFFNNIGASNKDLFKLLIDYQATLKWQDMNTMKIHVNEDSWEVVHNENGNLLFHNNYIHLEDYSRYFNEGYHEQPIYDRKNFYNMIQVMIGYSWADHVEKMKAEKVQPEHMNIAGMVTQVSDNTDDKPAARVTSGIMNYYQLRKFSFLYAHFAFPDTDEYLAKQIFIRNKVKVRFSKKYAKLGSGYVVVFYKVRKTQVNAFNESMQELERIMILQGRDDYRECSEQMEGMITQTPFRKFCKKVIDIMKSLC